MLFPSLVMHIRGRVTCDRHLGSQNNFHRVINGVLTAHHLEHGLLLSVHSFNGYAANFVPLYVPVVPIFYNKKGPWGFPG